MHLHGLISPKRTIRTYVKNWNLLTPTSYAQVGESKNKNDNYYCVMHLDGLISPKRTHICKKITPTSYAQVGKSKNKNDNFLEDHLKYNSTKFGANPPNILGGDSFFKKTAQNWHR